MSQDAPTPLFRTPIEVRWRDMDAFNHVNNATYLTYLEQARLAWLDTLDQGWYGPECAPVMASAHLDYRAPITWPARVEVQLDCQRIGRSSVTLGHRIVAADGGETLYCEGHVVLVWMNPNTGKSVPLPEVIRAALGNGPGD